MRVIIAKYKVSHSYKKALFIRNGSINETVGIAIGKTFTKEDAQKVMAKLNGRL